MTICRKCGKEIPDGQELCDECRQATNSSGESYLDGLMQNVETEGKQEPAASAVAAMSAASEELSADAINELLDMLTQDNSEVEEEEESAEPEPGHTEEDTGDRASETLRTIEPSLFLDNPEGGLFADGSGAEELAELELEEEAAPEKVSEEEPKAEPLPEETAEEEPKAEPLPEETAEAEPEEEPVPDIAPPEEAEEEAAVPEEPLPEMVETEAEPMPDMSLSEEPEVELNIEEPLPDEFMGAEDAPAPAPAEPDLTEVLDEAVSDEQAEQKRVLDEMTAEEDFTDILSELDSLEDPEEDMAAGDINVEDLPIGDMALDDSGLGEISLDEDFALEEPAAEMSSESTSVEEVFQEALSAVAYSEKEGGGAAESEPLALDEGAAPNILDEVEAIPAVEPTPKKKKREKKEKDPGKPGFFKRVFGNIVTDEDAAAEAKAREDEQAALEAKAAEKEEKKKQAELDKEAKAEQAKAEKERKAAAKAEKATAKAAEKEEKKRLKAEAAENEVVGRVNPVGATIVMVFFGLICVAVILGSQMLSYSSSVSRATTDFEAGEYEDAYESIAGVDVSESSQETVEKVRLCMKLQKQLDSYTNYYKMKLYLEALDALMRGMRNYDANRSKADEYGIISQYNALKDKIVATLSDEFNVTEDQARSILGTENQIDYTAKLEAIIAEWEKKIKEDEK